MSDRGFVDQYGARIEEGNYIVYVRGVGVLSLPAVARVLSIRWDEGQPVVKARAAIREGRQWVGRPVTILRADKLIRFPGEHLPQDVVEALDGEG